MVSLLAVWALGGVFMPMNIAQPKEKIKFLCEIVRPDISFASDSEEYSELLATEVKPISGSEDPLKNILPPQPEETAIIMFTSGTSRVPKAVPLTNRAIGHNCWHTAEKLGLTSDDRILLNSPPYYTSPIIHHLTLLSRGGTRP